ncbi:MAG: pilus assembly protein [Chloroflexi bacterium]|nr:pilus assembly protein [Chloroflexota bacterium]
MRKQSLQRGQSLVELALALPILMLVLLIVVDFGRAFYAYVTVTNASREGARYAASPPIRPP